MAKRFWGESLDDDGPDAKVGRTAEEADGGGDFIEATYFIEQRLVGFLIGTKGVTLREIEQEFQVKVSIDQSTKQQGYSQAKVVGPPHLVQQAAEHMNALLAGAAGGDAVGPFLLDAPPEAADSLDGERDELEIAQRFVGWLLGKGGGVIREIENSSGCKISINQETRDSGFSMVRFHGEPSQREVARQAITESIDRARAVSGESAEARAQDSFGGGNCEEMRIEQRFVGWVLGKSGAALREIEQESGCKISINQDTRSMGYSTVALQGDAQQRRQARRLVTESVGRAAGAAGGPSPPLPPPAVPPRPPTAGRDDMATLQKQVAAAALTCRDRLALLEALARLQAPPAVDPAALLGAVAAGGGGGGRREAAAAGRDHSVAQTVEQQRVGWLLGKGGVVLKEMEERSGASILIDQSTKASGFSTVRITGSPGAVQQARRLVNDKLAQASA